MKLVKVNQSFYDLVRDEHVDGEIMFNEQGRPCVLLVNLEYKGNLRKFVVPLRSNISAKAPRGQYFPLPPNKNTRPKCHHGVHYVKLFPIENQYVDKYRVDGKYYDVVKKILNENESVIVSACQAYLRQCETGNRHPMTPDIDGIINVLDSTVIEE